MANLPEIRDLKTLLEECYEKNVEIIHMNTKLLTAPGENYGSVMLAVDLNLKIENGTLKIKNLVAKMCPANEMLCEIFNVQVSFKKELRMYMNCVPALVDLEREYGIEEYNVGNMFAKCLGGRISLNPKSNVVDKDAVLLMENLKLIGYDIGDRLKGFDKEHSELLIRNLAQFHAVPIALKILKPKVFNDKVLPSLEGIFLGEALNEEGIQFMTDEVVDIIKTNEKCTPFIDRIIESIKYTLKGSYRLCTPREPFATAIHSDYWTNNTMILKNSSGKPIHNKMVDFQLQIYNSGVFDLLFFLFTSIESTVLETNLDYFIKFYHYSFIQKLTKFNVDISKFSWEIFNEEIKQVGPLELGHILIMLKPIFTERGIINDMANYDEKLMYRKDIVSKDFKSKILNTVLTFIDKKWI